MCSFIKNEALAQVFSCELWKISKNTIFAEHHQTTASDYSSINIISNEGRIGKRNCKLLYKNHKPIWRTRTLQVKQQVSEAVIRRLQDLKIF